MSATIATSTTKASASSTNGWSTIGKRDQRTKRPQRPSRKPTTTKRPQAPDANAKTVMCRFFEKDGKCPYGKRCTYAHGADQLQRRAPRKFDGPCWYFNHGGCSKSADQCVYEHVLAPEMRKPIHLQHPCPYFHYITPGKCRRGEGCGGDHFYELTADEWKHHFPEERFPGVGYFSRKPEPVAAPAPKTIDVQADNSEEFPVLGASRPEPTPIGAGAWGKKLVVKEDDPLPTPATKSSRTHRRRDSVAFNLPPPPKVTNPHKRKVKTETPSQHYNSWSKSWVDGPSWADMASDEEDDEGWWEQQPAPIFSDSPAPARVAETPTPIAPNDDIPDSWDDDEEDEREDLARAYDDNEQQDCPAALRIPASMRTPEPEQNLVCPPAPKKASSAELAQQVQNLQAQVGQLTQLLAESGTESKLPQLDGELKVLVTSALKQLLK